MLPAVTSCIELLCGGEPMIYQRPVVMISAAAVLLAGCGTPSFEWQGNGPPNVPSGPKVADLIQNLRCELKTATENTAQIPVGNNTSFSLKEWLGEIKYVATATYTLQVVENEGLNPSLTHI